MGINRADKVYSCSLKAYFPIKTYDVDVLIRPILCVLGIKNCL